MKYIHGITVVVWLIFSLIFLIAVPLMGIGMLVILLVAHISRVSSERHKEKMAILRDANK